MKKNNTEKVKLKVYVRENGESKVNVSFIYRNEVESTIKSWRERATVTGYSVETIEK